MPVPDEVWFVQMRNVETFLGPMPLDALTEMARTGVLLRHDLVRRDASAEWRSASELPELLGEFAVSVPSEEAAEAVVLADGDSLTLPNSTELSESVMTPAAADPDDPLAFAFASPSADVIVFASEPPQSAEPVSKPPSQLAFETSAEISVAETSEIVSNTTVPPVDATLPPTPSETTQASASVIVNDISLAETVAENLSSWSAPVPASRPAPPRSVPTKVRRGPSALARFSTALSELPALLSKPIDKRLIAAVTVLALLAWYFYPASRPTRRPPPQTAEVAGVIRLNGKPVSNALVLFRPDRSQGTIGPPSMGQTDAAGQFQLTINNSHSGAVVGKHQIAVRTRDSTGNPMSPGSVPERYTQVETSRLIAEVLPDQLNEITLDLTSN